MNCKRTTQRTQFLCIWVHGKSMPGYLIFFIPPRNAEDDVYVLFLRSILFLIIYTHEYLYVDMCTRMQTPEEVKKSSPWGWSSRQFLATRLDPLQEQCSLNHSAPFQGPVITHFMIHFLVVLLLFVFSWYSWSLSNFISIKIHFS